MVFVTQHTNTSGLVALRQWLQAEEEHGVLTGDNFVTVRQQAPYKRVDLHFTSPALTSGVPGTAASFISFGHNSAIQFDTPYYAELMKKLSTTPKHAHWAWHQAFEELKSLPEGQRTVKNLRALLKKAIENESKDLKRLEAWFDHIENMRSLPDEDLKYSLPFAFARILGVEPPEDFSFSVWTDSILPNAMQNAPEATDGHPYTYLVSFCKI